MNEQSQSWMNIAVRDLVSELGFRGLAAEGECIFCSLRQIWCPENHPCTSESSAITALLLTLSPPSVSFLNSAPFCDGGPKFSGVFSWELTFSGVKGL